MDLGQSTLMVQLRENQNGGKWGYARLHIGRGDSKRKTGFCNHLECSEFRSPFCLARTLSKRRMIFPDISSFSPF